MAIFYNVLAGILHAGLPSSLKSPHLTSPHQTLSGLLQVSKSCVVLIEVCLAD